MQQRLQSQQQQQHPARAVPAWMRSELAFALPRVPGCALFVAARERSLVPFGSQKTVSTQFSVYVRDQFRSSNHLRRFASFGDNEMLQF
jgi:hypothetical protein